MSAFIFEGKWKRKNLNCLKQNQELHQINLVKCYFEFKNREVKMNKKEKYLPLINRAKEIEKLVVEFQSNELLKRIPLELSIPEYPILVIEKTGLVADRVARRVGISLDSVENELAILISELGHAKDLAKQLDIEW